MNELQKLEKIASELINVYGITTPPVPVETMLRKPHNNMWKQVDINQLSGTFLSITDHFSPRMSLARLLARHAAYSNWGRERELDQLLAADPENIRAFARMLIMPMAMVSGLSNAARNPTTMSMKFEVPESDARTRLLELART